MAQDHDSADEVIAKLKNLNIQATDRAKSINNVNDFPNESIGMIAISGEDSNFCRITAVNMTCAMMFGYSKTELINRKLNILIPNIWS